MFWLILKRNLPFVYKLFFSVGNPQRESVSAASKLALLQFPPQVPSNHRFLCPQFPPSAFCSFLCFVGLEFEQTVLKTRGIYLTGDMDVHIIEASNKGSWVLCIQRYKVWVFLLKLFNCDCCIEWDIFLTWQSFITYLFISIYIFSLFAMCTIYQV